MLTKNFVERILMSVLGVLIGAASVGLFKLAAFGVDPFQAFMSGLDQLVPIEFGTLYIIVNVCLLLFALIFDRRYLGLATFINLFLVGYVVQFSYDTLRALIPDPSMAVRCISFVVGFVILCFALSMYITASLGVSTYDAIALVMAEKWKIGQFKYIRICSDVICVAAGAGLFLLGGGKAADLPAMIGLGTILTAFFMGPLIDFFNRKVSIPFLERRKNA